VSEIVIESGIEHLLIDFDSRTIRTLASEGNKSSYVLKEMLPAYRKAAGKSGKCFCTSYLITLYWYACRANLVYDEQGLECPRNRSAL
jgi:hypothetical protein